MKMSHKKKSSFYRTYVPPRSECRVFTANPMVVSIEALCPLYKTSKAVK